MNKLILVFFYVFIFNSPSFALVEVDITRGNLNPLPIAVSPLYIEPGSKDIKLDDKFIKYIGEDISKLTFNGHSDLIRLKNSCIDFEVFADFVFELSFLKVDSSGVIELLNRIDFSLLRILEIIAKNRSNKIKS